jgi:hypothetical protein
MISSRPENCSLSTNLVFLLFLLVRNYDRYKLLFLLHVQYADSDIKYFLTYMECSLGDLLFYDQSASAHSGYMRAIFLSFCTHSCLKRANISVLFYWGCSCFAALACLHAQHLFHNKYIAKCQCHIKPSQRHTN